MRPRTAADPTSSSSQPSSFSSSTSVSAADRRQDADELVLMPSPTYASAEASTPSLPSGALPPPPQLSAGYHQPHSAAAAAAYLPGLAPSQAYGGSSGLGGVGTPYGLAMAPSQAPFHTLPPLRPDYHDASGGFGLAGPGPSSFAAAQAANGGYSQPLTMQLPSTTEGANHKRRASTISLPAANGAVGPESADGHDGEDGHDGGKRVKTPRACDRCRGKKTRCDLIIGSEPLICKFCQKVRLVLTPVVRCRVAALTARSSGSSPSASAERTRVHFLPADHRNTLQEAADRVDERPA
jgi:hypothetical protein